MTQKPSYEELENRVKELELIVFGTKEFDEGLLSILSEAEKLANFGSWEWDMVRDKWTMSDNWLKIHGYTGKVLTTEELLTIAYPDDINRIQEAFNQCINNGKPYEIEHRIVRHETKEVRYIRAHGKVESDSTGKPVKLYGSGQDITEYKRQEIELKKSEEQYRSLVERTPDLVTMVDSEGRIVFVNHAAQNVYGLSPQECLGRSAFDFIHPDDRDATVASFNDWLRCPDNVLTYENRIVNIDGQRNYHMAWMILPERDESGSIIGFSGTARDITKKKQLEGMLLKEKAFLRSLINSAEDVIYFKDQNGLYQGCNKAAEKFLKTTESEQIGKSDFDFFERELAEHIVKQDQKVIASGKAIRIEESVTIPGSVSCIMETVKAPIYGVDGQSVGLVGISRDITERKLSQASLKATQERLSLALESGRMGAWDLDLVHDTAWRSLQHDQIFGYDSMLPEWGQDIFLSHVVPEDLDQVKDSFTQALLTDKLYFECRINRADQTLAWVHAEGNVFRDETNQPVRIMGVISDITERKQAEEQRLDLEEQLRQKYKMEAVGVMAGGMAHNFNNNLAIILGNLELSKGKLPPQSEVAEFLDYAKIAAVRSRDLVKQIMTYSRKEIQTQLPLQLSLLLKETFSLLQATIPSSVKLQQIINPDCLQTYIQADASQIQECLLNLCNNAVHAMGEQGELLLRLERVELKPEDISARYTCLPGNYLCLSIQDNGCGIPAEIQDKIFDPFFTTKELYDGTGMGLSTVQGIVEQHHGMIRVTSDIEQGAVFQLFFPVVDQQQREAAAVAEVELQRGSERILYVDDDEMVANLNEQLLSEMGYQVTIMTDSVEALKHFRANVDRYDLVMTDQTMPELTGKDLIQKIKKLRPELPTILCTGYSSKVNEEDARQLGISAFLMKPTDFMEMSQVIRTVLEKPSIM